MERIQLTSYLAIEKTDRGTLRLSNSRVEILISDLVMLDDRQIERAEIERIGDCLRIFPLVRRSARH